MADYIKREDVMNTFLNYGIGWGAAKVKGVINSIPAADVVERKKGKWIKPTRVPDSMLEECSVCGFDCGAYTFNYCPNCGADMRGE